MKQNAHKIQTKQFSIVFAYLCLIIELHSGIEGTSEEDIKYSFDKRKVNDTLKSLNKDTFQEGALNGTITATTSSSNIPIDKSRFWWTNRNRTNSKVPTTESFPMNVDQKSPLKLISELLRYVIINKDSVSRMQFYNANYQSNSSAVNQTVPRAIFGGPLCLGLCGIAQVYWANSSVHYLSGNTFPFPAINPPSTVFPPPRPPSPPTPFPG